VSRNARSLRAEPQATPIPSRRLCFGLDLFPFLSCYPSQLAPDHVLLCLTLRRASHLASLRWQTAHWHTIVASKWFPGQSSQHSDHQRQCIRRTASRLARQLRHSPWPRSNLNRAASTVQSEPYSKHTSLLIPVHQQNMLLVRTSWWGAGDYEQLGVIPVRLCRGTCVVIARLWLYQLKCFLLLRQVLTGPRLNKSTFPVMMALSAFAEWDSQYNLRKLIAWPAG